jgi:HSP20 family protein
MALLRFSSGFDPVAGLEALQRELERVFDKPFGIDLGPSGRGVFPPVNVFSDRDSYVVKLEVPGIAPEDVSIEAEGRTLTVSGKREVPAPSGGSFHRRERGTGRFSRSLQLPADLDLSRAEASCKHGILTVRVPKREEAKPRQITVKAA